MRTAVLRDGRVVGVLDLVKLLRIRSSTPRTRPKVPEEYAFILKFEEGFRQQKKTEDHDNERSRRACSSVCQMTVSRM
jgi:hypothetical protein